MTGQTLFSFFSDPVLRAPTIGCMLMCLSASLMGVIVFLRKQSLIGETLSHAAYPGLICGVIISGILTLGENDDFQISLITLTCAFITALLGLWSIQILEKRCRVSSDAALCFVLSTFFGVGVTITSEVQFSFTPLYKQAITYLYGQAATMTDIHVWVYGSLSLLMLVFLAFIYKELKIIIFDRQYAKSLGISVKTIETLLFFLVALAVIIGIRSVGVVLMSAMLIAPAVAARQFTHQLGVLFALAAFFGLLSGFLGNYFSVQLTDEFAQLYPSSRMILPTGPMIVLVATFICICSLLFAPERGLLLRLWRVGKFRYICICENILKGIGRISPEAKVTFKEIEKYQTIPPLYLKFLLWRLIKKGWIKQEGHFYLLTAKGQLQAVKIIRLHRLWEVYLADYLGIGIEKVHRNAEEMEHIITPELEKELTLLLNHPLRDPHQKPIPSIEGLNAH